MGRLFRFVVLFMALLLSSLHSHGAYVLMSGILLLCVYCIFTTDARSELLTRRSLLLTLSGVCAVSACFFCYLVFPNPVGAPALEKSALNNYLFLILVICFVVCLRSLIRTQIRPLTFTLSALIILNDLVLFVQTVVLAVSKNYLDFVKPVTGEESRYLNYEYLNPVFGFRPTGLYVEPSTFSAAVAAMAIGYVLLCRAQQRQASVWPLAFTITAMLITQSVAAAIQCLILLFAVLLMQKKSVKLWSAAVCAVVVLAGSGVLITYYDSFMMRMDESSGIRLALLEYIYHTRTGWDLLFGFGPLSLENALYRMTKPEGQFQVASLNDAGLLHYFVVHFGLVGLAFPAAIFLRMRKDITSILFLALLLSSKLSYTFPVLYLGLLPLLVRLPAGSARTTVQDVSESARLEQPMARVR